MKKKKETLEDRIKASQESHLKEVTDDMRYLDNRPPTRLFKVGERVKWGAHTEVYVDEVLFEGLIYKLRTHFHQDPQSQRSNIPEGTPDYHYLSWVNVFPYKNDNKTSFSVDNDIFIRYLNSDITSLISKHYHSGIDYTPEYQRDYVWELSDKVALVDSIMCNVDIGKFTFVSLSYEEGHKRDDRFYEILDGKQRIQAIIDFYEDRFLYNGLKFSELSVKDQQVFMSHAIAYCELENLNREQILRTFIKLNTTGKVMDAMHLDKIKDKWLEELKK